MRPGPARGQKRERRLPRTRGDAPAEFMARRRLAEAAPHTRGYAAAAAGDLVMRGGCPAHAGMHPSMVVEIDRPAGFDPRLGSLVDAAEVRLYSPRRWLPDRGWAGATVQVFSRTPGFDRVF